MGRLIRRTLKLTSLLFMLGDASAATAQTLADVCGKCRPEKVATCDGSKMLEGITADSSGTIWLLDPPGGRVLSITKQGQCITRGMGDGNAVGARFRQDGMLVLANDSGVALFDPRTQKTQPLATSFEGRPIVGANGVALDSKGGIYVGMVNRSDLVNPVGLLLYLAPGASEPMKFMGGMAYPNGVVVTPNQQAVLVSEFSLKRIDSVLAATYTGLGQRVSYVYAYTVDGVGVDGIIMDAEGRLFAANPKAGEVLVYDKWPNPRLMGAIRLPGAAGSVVTDVAVSGGYLYMCVADTAQVWRVRLN